MSNLEMILFGIFVILALMLAELWGSLSDIINRLQDVDRSICSLKEKDDE